MPIRWPLFHRRLRAGIQPEEGGAGRQLDEGGRRARPASFTLSKSGFAFRRHTAVNNLIELDKAFKDRR